MISSLFSQVTRLMCYCKKFGRARILMNAMDRLLISVWSTIWQHKKCKRLQESTLGLSKCLCKTLMPMWTTRSIGTSINLDITLFHISISRISYQLLVWSFCSSTSISSTWNYSTDWIWKVSLSSDRLPYLNQRSRNITVSIILVLFLVQH